MEEDDLETKVRRFVEISSRQEEDVARFLSQELSLTQLLKFAAEREAAASKESLVNPHVARSALRIVLSTSVGAGALCGEAFEMFCWGLSCDALASVRSETLKCTKLLCQSATKDVIKSLIEPVAKAILSDDVGVCEAACDTAAEMAKRDIHCYHIAMRLAGNIIVKQLRCLDAGCRCLVAIGQSNTEEYGDLIQHLATACSWDHDPLSRLVALELIKKTATQHTCAQILCNHVLLEPLLSIAQDTEDPFATSEHALAALAELVIGADTALQDTSRLLALTLSRLSDDNQYHVAALRAVARLAKANKTEVLLNPQLADAWLCWPQNEASYIRLARLDALTNVFTSSSTAAVNCWSKLTSKQLVHGIFQIAQDYAKSEAVAVAGIDTLAAAIANVPDALDYLLNEFNDFYAWLVSDDSDGAGGAFFTPPLAHAKYRLLVAVANKTPTPFNAATATLITSLINQGPFRPTTRPASFLVADS